MSTDLAQPVDWLISGATLVTMDPQRRIVEDAYLAVRDDRIAAIGKRSELDPQLAGEARHTVDGRRFVVTPGFINGHIHITGEPLTRSYVPDDLDFAESVFQWMVPLYQAHTPEDEQLSAQIAATEMLRTGTTCFLEAATILDLDAVVDGLRGAGIRGRVGRWTMDRAFDSSQNQTALIDAAIRGLEDELERHPAADGRRIAAWPSLVGHSTNTDTVWQAAKQLADRSGTGISAHMSPTTLGPDWYLEHTGRRPIEHLAHLGVLGGNLSLTHAVHLDAHEVELLAQSGTNVAHCPMAALRGGYGVAAVGRFPEMAAAGVNLTLGTDGNTGNSSDLMKAIYLVAGLFKDARRDTKQFPAHAALTMATLNGARALGLEDQIGSLEVGKKADFVLHDTARLEWQPLFNVVNQLVWSADGRSVHSVWVDGVRVVDNHRSTLLDEDELLARAKVAGTAIVKRSGLPLRQPWPVV